MLVQPWHERDEIAGSVPGIELVAQDAVPGVSAGAGAARQGKKDRALRNATGGPALHRARADAFHRDDGEKRRKGLDLLFIDIAMCLDRDIAAGDPGAAG